MWEDGRPVRSSAFTKRMKEILTRAGMIEHGRLRRVQFAPRRGVDSCSGRSGRPINQDYRQVEVIHVQNVRSTEQEKVRAQLKAASLTTASDNWSSLRRKRELLKQPERQHKETWEGGEKLVSGVALANNRMLLWLVTMQICIVRHSTQLPPTYVFDAPNLI